jgi:hypothetical protein
VGPKRGRTEEGTGPKGTGTERRDGPKKPGNLPKWGREELKGSEWALSKEPGGQVRMDPQQVRSTRWGPKRGQTPKGEDEPQPGAELRTDP